MDLHSLQIFVQTNMDIAGIIKINMDMDNDMLKIKQQHRIETVIEDGDK